VPNKSIFEKPVQDQRLPLPCTVKDRQALSGV